ncbi:MAG: hypothetical protein NTV01_03825, partial [Bacteroidia bacterium]|nr:hypothetical protein [Bacteroidia bacterium]
MITTFPEDTEVQTAALVTVKVYVPAAKPEIVVVVPVPVEVVPPGVLVNVQVPLPGKPDKSTLPVARAQVGCVMVPTAGAVGVTGCVLITTFPEDTEVQTAALVTVKVYIPAAKPDIVVVVPVPVLVVPPGVLVNVQVPLPGKPDKSTLPVA